MKKKVLLIDHDVALTSQVKRYLESEGFDVCIRNNAIEGFNEVTNHQYNLIMLDIVTPNLDGYELLKSLKAIYSGPLMILTARDEHFDRIYALENGADDYLLKPVNQRELLARIKVNIRRSVGVGSQTSTSNFNINNIHLSRGTREVYCEQNLLELTGSEFEVLYFLMANAGKINSKESISKSVFGRPVSYYDRSIDMHISNIRKKISRHREQPHIKTVRGLGYTFLLEESHHHASAMNS